MKNKIIFTALSPNVQKDDFWLSLKILVKPWVWKKGESLDKLELALKEYLPAKHIFLMNSGRGCLKTILKALTLKPGDEVLLQAYTCVATSEPIIWVGARPVFVDIETDNFNMSPVDLEKKITPKCKAIIIQHTFGAPAKLQELIAIAKKYNLFIIEDCAHALGAEYQGKKVGTFGDVSFFSFGRDKVISSVFGGAIATNNEELSKKLAFIYSNYSYSSKFWIIQQFIHPIITYLAKKVYDFLGLGKLIIYFFKKIKFLSQAVQKEERQIQEPNFLNKKLPNALSALALHQFNKLEILNNHRIKIAEYYHKNINIADITKPVFSTSDKNIYLRYTIQVPEPEKLIAAAKQQNILLDNWYAAPIVPDDCDYDKINYQLGSCLQAEQVAKKSVNLPTNINITLEQADQIILFLKNYYHHGS